MPRQTYGEDGESLQGGIVLPVVERHRREKIVVADHDVRLVRVHETRDFARSDTRHRRHTDSFEESAEMFAEELMARYAQHSHAGNIAVRTDV
jgi:hypothetical protein